jgi:hypothetical protein
VIPLDMPESVLIKFTGEMQSGITLRDLVNAIPYAAIQQGLLSEATVAGAGHPDRRGLHWLLHDQHRPFPHRRGHYGGLLGLVSIRRRQTV